MAFNDITNRDGYSPEDQAVLAEAKRIHKGTTASAQRALKTAEKTQELAANTLNELHRQGQKLDMVDRDLNEIDVDVDEGKSILRYMRRCCLFFLCSCCCDCDSDKMRDATRKDRVKMRKQARKHEQEIYSRADASRATDKPGYHGPVDEAKARSELFEQANGAKGRLQAQARARNANKWQIGDNLADEDRAEVQQETAIQDQALEKIGDALTSLQRMGTEMHEEIDRQDVKLQAVQEHTSDTHGKLADVTHVARKDFRLRGR
ncbi:hypothetical protein WJX72_008754 [[Myrmecia] bisecta]|uniref:t-SNARE coiled-coil homology domain-containing protein n=1 Tax=[Myrmecia] bisecta TaxID=41462 RepID=A0AAW1PHU2_9CHLO